MDSPKFETEVLSLLSALKAKKEKIKAEFEAALLAVDGEIEAVSTTARLLRKTIITPEPRPVVVPLISSGMTIRQACIEIAKSNKGIVRVREAKDALIEAGVLRRTKNSWGIVNTTLQRSKEFRKHPSEQGAFILIEEWQQGQLSVAS